MHIGIDLTSLLPRSTGVDVSLMGLVSGLAACDRENRYTLFLNVADRDSRWDSLPGNFRIMAASYRPRAVRLAFQQLGLPVLSRALGIDVLHSPSFIKPLYGGGSAQVLTIHDMTPFSNPAWHPPIRSSAAYRRGVTLSIRHADRIIVPSAHVKRTVIEHVPERQGDSISVIPWGLSPEFRTHDPEESRSVLRELDLPERNILFLSTVERRKNLHGLLQAFRMLTEDRGFSEHLVVAGGAGWGTHGIRRDPAFSSIRKRVRYLGYVPQDMLPHLYGQARLFVYPSFEEGFGFPPLEAMACGTPVIASSNSSLKENLGDAATLVAPTDPAAMASAMQRLLNDEAARETHRQRGLECAGRFSWHETARLTMSCYREVAAGLDGR